MEGRLGEGKGKEEGRLERGEGKGRGMRREGKGRLGEGVAPPNKNFPLHHWLQQSTLSRVHRVRVSSSYISMPAVFPP